MVDTNTPIEIPKSKFSASKILGLSVLITLGSLAYIITHICLPFYCGQPTIFDHLAYYGALNSIIFIPLALFKARGIGKGYKIIIFNIVLALIAALPLIYMGWQSISLKIAMRNDQAMQAERKSGQESQVALAKQSNISIQPGKVTLVKIRENSVEDIYSLYVPIEVSNIPDGITMYNVDCKKIQLSSGEFIDYTTYTMYYGCGYVNARKVDGAWAYKGYDLAISKPTDTSSISIFFRTKHGEKLPSLKLLPLTLSIPATDSQYSTGQVFPGALSEEDSIIARADVDLSQLNK